MVQCNKSLVLRTLKVLLVWILIMPEISSLHAQTLELSPVVLPSPRSREFEKFINYKVSLYNGLPEIGVNFYSIELDGVVIPIGVSYHASGIKFGQTSGDVGIGWQLNPSYRVTRTVNGRLDELYTMPDMNNIGGNTIGYYLNNNFATPFQRDLYLARFLNLRPGEVPAVAASQNDYLDGQFDLFTIGLPTQSGNFIITDRVNKVVSMLNNAALSKINYTTDNVGINNFTVTDGNAVQYKFGENDSNNEGLQVFVNGAYRKYNTAWMLKDITTPFNNKIYFQYQLISESSSGMPSYNRTLIEGIKPTGDYTPDCVSTVDNSGVVSPATTSDYTSKVLSSITTQNEIVTFNRNPNGMITSIVVTRPDGSPVKSIYFFYSQPSSRTFLDTLHIADKNNAVVERYLFDYTSKILSFTNYDCFGYPINNSGGIHYYANEYGRHDFNKVGLDCSQIPDHVEFQGLIKRSQLASTAGMLNRITFPTGGSQEFVYETNKYRTDNPLFPIISGGGFRISKITSKTATGQTALIRNYYYGNEGVRTIDPTDPIYSVTQKVNLANLFNNTPHIFSVKKTSHSSIIDGEITEAASQENSGWYDQVTEDYGAGKIEYKFNIPNSNIVLEKYPTNDPASRPFHPYYMTQYNYWNKPYLSEKTTYKNELTVYTPVQKEKFEYYLPSPSPSDEFIGLKVAPFALINGNNLTVQTAEPAFSLYTESGINSVFNYATYKLTRGDVLLKKKILTDYDQGSGSEITTTTDLTYTTNNLIANERTTNSTGEVSITNYKYPFNYSGITATDNLSLGVKNLININYINPVIEKSSYRALLDNTNKRLLSSSFTAYKPDLPVPDKVFTTKTNGPITNFAESLVQGGAVTKNSAYEERLSFDLYNTKGKLLQQAKTNDVKHSYIWGYNLQYPIASVTGAEQKDIYYTSFEDGEGTSTTGYSKTGKFSRLDGYVKSLSGLTNGNYRLTYWEKPSGSWVFQSFLVSVTAGSYVISIPYTVDEIRFYPENAQMITYCYEPLVGITHHNDENNRITTYEYDAFGRLSIVRDQDRNILKKICYNYAGQPDNCSSCTTTTPDWQPTNTPKRCEKNGGGGNTGYLEQEIRDVNSCSPNFNMLTWVRAEENTNACPVSSTVNLTSYNPYGYSEYQATFTNTSTGQYFSFNVSSTDGAFLGTVPSGNYDVYVNNSGPGTTATFFAVCSSYTTPGNVIYNVNISNAGCSTLLIDNQ